MTLDPANVDFLMVLAQLDIEQGGDPRETILRVLALAPQRHREVVPLCQRLAAAGHAESAQACLDAVADLALLDGEPEQAVDRLRRLLAGSAEPRPAAAAAPAGARDLETVFADIRTRVTQEQQASGPQLYYRGLDRLVAGDVPGALADLQEAARIPLFRFAASAQLARLAVEQNDLARAVEWFERAAEAPAPTPAEAHAVLYELADALERLGEAARALAVLIELDGDAAGYRDVRRRIEQLSRTQA